MRVDVDTRRGLEDGVPRLLALFRSLGVTASFFVTMGPDRSGLALRRLWRPSFLAKMYRTRAWRLYGPRTLLSGTLLPAPLVGAGAPALLRQIAAEGHELAPHGYDHVRWQDRVHRLSVPDVRHEVAAAADAFAAATGVRAEATAAPGWRTTADALVVQDDFGYRYASDVRGATPFRPLVEGRPLKTMQIPTTMPTMDELLGRVRDIPHDLRERIGPGLNVFTLHAEVEGGSLLPLCRDFLESLRRAGVELSRLGDAADAVMWGEAPTSRIRRAKVAGRSGWVAMQATGGSRA
ncbi:MAG TPA: polysaccharide deacetylase family protein [Methylomirabilota bacterium]|nr:polysaccharide deacetylase family protein [Methylomirabilota bacterium]